MTSMKHEECLLERLIAKARSMFLFISYSNVVLQLKKEVKLRMCNKLNLIFYYVSTLGVLPNFDLARWRFSPEATNENDCCTLQVGEHEISCEKAFPLTAEDVGNSIFVYLDLRSRLR